MLPYGGFEGNGQTLRIMTKLEKYPEGCGMNLTRRAVLGVIKYPAPFSKIVDWSIVPDGEPKPPMAELPEDAQPDDEPLEVTTRRGCSRRC